MSIENNNDLKEFRKEQRVEYNGRKHRGFGRLVNSFKFSFQGFVYAYKNEQSLSLHALILVLAVIGGLYFDIARIEWLFVLMMSGLVIAIELINTSIEATIDLYTEKFHPLAKIAKDTGSAAVLSLALVAFAGALIIFIPYIFDKWF